MNESGAYREGYQAYQNERSPEDNPYSYHRNYDSFSDWEDGWYTAELDANDDFIDFDDTNNLTPGDEAVLGDRG